MQVQTANAPATYEQDGERWYFCCDGCRDKFAVQWSAGNGH
jgi:YHS domain-containing protein